MNMTHRFYVGAIECTVLADGSAGYGMDKLAMRFPSIGEADLAGALLACGEEPDGQVSYYNPLLIRVGGDTILVDGGERADRHVTTGRTPQCLVELGIKPEEIDTVVITHAHGDHIVGLFETDNETLRYPKARYLISQTEWDFWMAQSRPNGSVMSAWLAGLAPYVEFLEGDGVIRPGIKAIPASGHTPGHICLLIESEGERLLHGVDLVHSPIQFANPDWSIKFDIDPAQARATRRALFGQLADEALLTLFYHMPFPGLGYIDRIGEGFVWRAVE